MISWDDFKAMSNQTAKQFLLDESKSYRKTKWSNQETVANLLKEAVRWHKLQKILKFTCQITFYFKITSVLEGKKEKDSQVEDRTTTLM